MFGEFTGFDLSAVSTRSAWAWSYLTVIGPVAFVAYAWLLRNAPIPLVATYSYVNPLVAIMLGYFLGKEIHHDAHSAGSGINHWLGGSSQRAKVALTNSKFQITYSRFFDMSWA